MEKHPRKVLSGHLSLYIVLLRTRLVNLSVTYYMTKTGARQHMTQIVYTSKGMEWKSHFSFLWMLMFENLLAKTQQAVVQSFIQNGSKKSLRSSPYGAGTLDVKAKTGSLFGSFSMKEIFHNVNTVINSKRLIVMGLMKY